MMNEFISKSLAFIKANIIIALIIGFAIIYLLFPRQIKKLFSGRRRVRHRRPIAMPARRRRTMRRPLPRSVGMHKARPQYNKSGKQKKPWQIKGSEAARRHMAKIRRMR